MLFLTTSIRQEQCAGLSNSTANSSDYFRDRIILEEFWLLGDNAMKSIENQTIFSAERVMKISQVRNLYKTGNNQVTCFMLVS
jgi:hypothetical protein